MTAKRVIERRQAVEDIEAATDYYLLEGSESAAMGLLDALQAAYRDIAEHPAAGSPLYGELLSIEGLRSWTLGRYPYLVLYIEEHDHVDVWRVAHGRRDLPPLLREQP